jgi:hypothetical protein
MWTTRGNKATQIRVSEPRGWLAGGSCATRAARDRFKRAEALSLSLRSVDSALFSVSLSHSQGGVNFNPVDPSVHGAAHFAARLNFVHLH